MSLSNAALDAMVAAGMSAEAIVSIIKADRQKNVDESVLEARREKDRERKRAERAAEKSRLSELSISVQNGHDRTGEDKPPDPQPVAAAPPSVSQQVESLCESQAVTKETAENGGVSLTYLPSSFSDSVEEGKKERGRDTRARAREAGFDQFWEVYPEKKAKVAAEKAFLKAIESGVSLDTILAGVARYKIQKPADIHYCHPAKWLNDGRWEDQPAELPLNGGNGNAKSASHHPRNWKESRDEWRAALSEFSDHIAEITVGEEGGGSDVPFAAAAGRERSTGVHGGNGHAVFELSGRGVSDGSDRPGEGHSRANGSSYAQDHEGGSGRTQRVVPAGDRADSSGAECGASASAGAQAYSADAGGAGEGGSAGSECSPSTRHSRRWYASS